MFKFLLILLFIILVLRMFRRQIFISVINAYQNKMKQDFEKHQSQRNKPEGSVTIEKIKQSKNKHKNNEDGEYVNYEEVK